MPERFHKLQTEFALLISDFLASADSVELVEDPEGPDFIQVRIGKKVYPYYQDTDSLVFLEMLNYF